MPIGDENLFQQNHSTEKKPVHAIIQVEGTFDSIVTKIDIFFIEMRGFFSENKRKLYLNPILSLESEVTLRVAKNTRISFTSESKLNLILFRIIKKVSDVRHSLKERSGKPRSPPMDCIIYHGGCILCMLTSLTSIPTFKFFE